MNREDIELYVMGQYDGDVAALERAIADDPALAQIAADEAGLEVLLRSAAAAATFCAACDDLVPTRHGSDQSGSRAGVVGERCDSCGCAVRPGGYTVERVLVSNAHGRMYVARDADGKKVALKELAFVHAPSAEAQAAFEREAKFLRALEYPAIPKFLASWQEGEGVHARYYLAQELVDGTPLDRLDDHWYSEAEIVGVAKQVLAILVYLQSLSPMVIHRDIKPANLIKRADGSIALVDFGAAHVHGTTAGSTTVGTFGYMPIEQLAGEVDATTDLYALGATLVHLLTRQEPWRIAQTKTAINASAPVRAFLDRLMAAAPKDRFASAKDALAALDKPVIAAKRRRAPLAAIAAGAAVLAAGGGTFYAFHHKSPAIAPPAEAFATLVVHTSVHGQLALAIDGRTVAQVADGTSVPLPAGHRHIVLTAPHGQRCEADAMLEPGKTTTVECAVPVAPPSPPEAHLHVDKKISWDLNHVLLTDAMLVFSSSCGVNVVVPDTIELPITVNLDNVPCDQALEVVLESHGLWYAYDQDANLVRIAPRKELAREAVEAMARAGRPHAGDALPTAGRVDKVSRKAVPLRPLLAMLAHTSAQPLNLVIPDDIDGSVTVDLDGTPWRAALEAVLASKGLWYRYREAGHILRIAPRKELDREDEDAAARGSR